MERDIPIVIWVGTSRTLIGEKSTVYNNINILRINISGIRFVTLGAHEVHPALLTRL